MSDATRRPWPHQIWERRTPYIEIEERWLIPLCEHALGRRDVVDYHRLEGGQCNTNIGLKFADGSRLAMRIYEGAPGLCKRDETLMSRLCDRVPVARMVARVPAPEDIVPDVSQSLRGHAVGFFEWVDGDPPPAVMAAYGPTTGRVVTYQMGKVLAHIGEAERFSHHGRLDETLDFRRRFDSNRASLVAFIEWSLKQGKAAEALSASLASQLRRYVDDRAHRLDVTEDCYRLVHGDYKPANLLVGRRDGNWEVRAVLDWEFVRAGSPLSDVAAMMRHTSRWPPSLERSFLRGFIEHGGRLPTHWKSIARLYDLKTLCGVLNASSQRHRCVALARYHIERILASDEDPCSSDVRQRS